MIDQDDFYDALLNNQISGAGIDTFPDDQTIKTTNEKIMRFAKLPNVVSTPHMAFNTKEASERLGVELIKDIESCVANIPINVVN